MPTLSDSYAAIRQWVHRRQLRAEHKKTLARYKEGDFRNVDVSISIADALREGVLDPQHLRGDSLLRLAPSLDATVWKAWHDSSKLRLEAYKEFYYADTETLEKNFPSVYASLMPFESLIETANKAGSLPLLKWLHALPDPWREIDWRPAQFVGAHRKVGEWALDLFPGLHLTRGHAQSLARHLLWDENRNNPATQQPKWMRWIDKSAFYVQGWSDDRAEQQAIRAYATRVLNTLLPQQSWDWRKRWESIGKEMAPAISTSSRKQDQIRMSGCHGVMMAALLHEAPENIQMILCGFKRARHPDEPNKGNPDAQFVRNHFYAEKAPTEPISPIVSAAFLFIQGVDPDVEVGFMLDQLTRDPNAPPESYPIDGMNL